MKDRFALTGSMSERSYFCEAYRQFFDHALGEFQAMAAQLQAKPQVKPRKRR